MIADQIISITDLRQNVLFLLNNPSLDFLKNEPDLYE